MTPDKIEDYIEKVYGYAVHHTYSSDEADELSQDLHAEVPRLALHPQVVGLDELLVAAVVAQNDVVATSLSRLSRYISFSRGVMAT